MFSHDKSDAIVLHDGVLFLYVCFLQIRRGVVLFQYQPPTAREVDGLPNAGLIHFGEVVARPKLGSACRPAVEKGLDWPRFLGWPLSSPIGAPSRSPFFCLPLR